MIFNLYQNMGKGSEKKDTNIQLNTKHLIANGFDKEMPVFDLSNLIHGL